MKRRDYTIYHITHKEFLHKHSMKCALLSNESVHLFDGTNYSSFAKTINSCVANCPTEIVIIFSHKVYPFPDEIEKILHYIDSGYAFVALYRFAFFGFKKEVFRRIGFLDERFEPGGYEDLDLIIRMKEANFGVYISEESIYGSEKSGWRNNEKPGIHVPLEHFCRKWGISFYEFKKQINDSERIPKERRRLSEEQYDYNLGPTTDIEFVSWKDTIINPTSYGKFNNPENLQYNIYDKRLKLKGSFKHLWHVENYSALTEWSV